VYQRAKSLSPWNIYSDVLEDEEEDQEHQPIKDKKKSVEQLDTIYYVDTRQ